MITENKRPMKYVFLFASLFLSARSIGQGRPLVEYKDGAEPFKRLMAMAYMRSATEANGQFPDSSIHYLTILFTVDSTGRIGDQIFATTIGDTLNRPKLRVTDAIRRTSGAWINHTGHSIWVEQTFSLRSRELVKSTLPPAPVRTNVYGTGEHPADLVRLEPIPVESYGSVTLASRSTKDGQN